MTILQSDIFSRKWLPVTAAGLLFAVVYMAIQDYIAVPWNDEIGTADTAVNYVLFGKWDSNVWHYTYNPLHAFLLIGWLKIFGISHAIVCNMNVFIALLAFLYLEHTIVKRSIITKQKSGIALVLLFWLGFMLASIMTKGRIDILVMFLSIILADCLFDNDKGIMAYAKIFISSTLLIMSSIYVIPFFVLVIIFFYAIDFCEIGRTQWLIKGSVTTLGFIVGMGFVCVFYYNIEFLYHFLSTYVSFNGSISEASKSLSIRLFEAYNSDPISILLCACAWLIVVIGKKKDKRFLTILAIVTLIPAIMTFAGRYASYYVWMVELPVAVLIVYLLDTTEKKSIYYVLLAVVAVSSMFRPAYWINKRPAEYTQRMELYSFIAKNSEYLTQTDNVYFQDAMCYYKVVEHRKARYYLYNDNLHVNPKIIDALSSLDAFKDYKEYYPDEYLPEEGIMISTPKWTLDTGTRELQSHNYSFQLLAQDGEYAISSFKRN